MKYEMIVQVKGQTKLVRNLTQGQALRMVVIYKQQNIKFKLFKTK